MMTTREPSGMFDPSSSLEQMSGLISEVTGTGVEEVRRRLVREGRWPGTSVRQAFEKEIRRHGAERYVYNAAMERFYGSTDSFLYELAIWNLNDLKKEMVKWCCDWVSKHIGPSKVLSIGDGLGFDGLRFAEAGHELTYFEVPGYGSEFARILFERKGVAIQHLTDPARIPSGGFDVLACLDVLEHVPDPAEFVNVLKGYLKPGGFLVVHAPFYMIHPAYPTHVLASRKYSGNLSLYKQVGFRVIDGRAFWNPLVLQAPGGSQRSASFPGIARLLAGKPYLMLGRKSTKPFRMIQRIKRKHQHWFEDDSSIS